MAVHSDLEDALVAFVTHELLAGQPDVRLQPDDDLLTSGFVDSIGVMRLVQFIDMEWEVRVPPADITLENFLTVRRIAAYLSQQRSPGATAGPVDAS